MDLGQLVHDYGWPTAVLVIAAITGWRGMWRYGPQVDRENAERDKRLADKDRQIEKLEKSNAETLAMHISLLQSVRQSADNQGQIASVVREAIEATRGK